MDREPWRDVERHRELQSDTEAQRGADRHIERERQRERCRCMGSADAVVALSTSADVHCFPSSKCLERKHNIDTWSEFY